MSFPKYYVELSYTVPDAVVTFDPLDKYNSEPNNKGPFIFKDEGGVTVVINPAGGESASVLTAVSEAMVEAHEYLIELTKSLGRADAIPDPWQIKVVDGELMAEHFAGVRTTKNGETGPELVGGGVK